MRVTKRLPYEFLIAALLTLGSCDYQATKSAFTMEQRDEARDLARETTADDISSLKDRVDAIEQRLNMPDGGS